MVHIVEQLLFFIPLLFYILLFFKRNKVYKIQPISLAWSVIILLVMSILLVLTPIEEETDKYNYMMEFLGETPERNSEIAWVVYNSVFRSLFQGNIIAFFLFNAILYSFSYYVLARKLFDKDVVGYFIIMAVGSLGFVAYGCNTIRAGIAIGLLFIAFSLPYKLRYRLSLVLIAILIHKSMIIPVFAFIISSYIKNRRFIELFWIICLLISILDFNLSTIFEKLGFVDSRVDQYMSSIGEDSDYGSKFRFDFLLYSLIPLFFANIWIKKYKYSNYLYSKVYNTYLISNAIWLLVIRIEYSDRVAYLSWFLIPILVLYPILKKELIIKNAQIIVLFSMGVFIGTNVLLNLR